MEVFVVSYPDRKDAKSELVAGVNKRDVWDSFHQKHPYERIEVTPAKRSADIILEE